MAKETILADFHRAHKGRMVEFAGWLLPVMYTSIIEEHMAVREGVGVFDVSHMGQAELEGEDALAFLNYALTNDFSSLENGQAKYALLCNDKGECLDDLIVYRLSATKFLIVLNASNTATDLEALRGTLALGNFKSRLTDLSDQLSMLAVQGAKALEAMQKIFGKDFSSLEKFTFTEFEGNFISRTGYTGSDGFEIICKNEDATALMQKCVDAGVKLCGLGARDSLRLEARYPLYGHELSKEINAFEANLGWAVKLDKNFVGRDALKKIKEAGLSRKVAHVKALDKRIVRDGEKIYFEENVVGKVLSGAWSPILNAPIASVLVESEYLSKELFAKVRDNRIALEFNKKFI